MASGKEKSIFLCDKYLRRDKLVAEDLGYKSKIKGGFVMVRIMNEHSRLEWVVFTNPTSYE